MRYVTIRILRSPQNRRKSILKLQFQGGRTIVTNRKKLGMPANVLGSSLESKRARVTLILSQALDQNMELLCLVRGEKKADVVQSAIREYLLKHGVANPDLDPKAKVAGLLKLTQ
jgi:hypothetical protein